MLSWAFTFLVIGIMAGLLGFSGVAGVATLIAKVLFGTFLLICLVLFGLALFLGKKMT